MARLVIIPVASDDQARILEELEAEAGVVISLKYNQAFFSVFRRLIEHPESGSRRPRMGRDVRIAVVSPYLVIYRYYRGDDTVRILRVLHAKRNITRNLVKASGG